MMEIHNIWNSRPFFMYFRCVLCGAPVYPTSRLNSRLILHDFFNKTLSIIDLGAFFECLEFREMVRLVKNSREFVPYQLSQMLFPCFFFLPQKMVVMHAHSVDVYRCKFMLWYELKCVVVVLRSGFNQFRRFLPLIEPTHAQNHAKIPAKNGQLFLAFQINDNFV